MDLETLERLKKCNRLVVHPKDVNWEDYDGLGSEAFLVAVQSLPVDVNETLRLDFVALDGMNATWFVERKSPVEYYFFWPFGDVGGRFLTGGVDPESGMETPIGWIPPTGGTKWLGDELAGMIQAMLIWFFEEVEKRRLYPFVRNPVQDPAAVKNPSKRKKLEEQTNVIVYLGRPPGETTKKPDSEKTPREFGYPRRQHRRTLRSERFKNHPKYGVYKGVLVTQAWCGPKEYFHNRKVYRLWEPPEVDVFS